MKTKPFFLISAACAISLLTAPAALAAGAGKDHRANHGGQFREIEGHHGIEMVATADSLTFHITENHKPLDVTGSAFKVVIQTTSGTKMFPLIAKRNTLTTKLDAPLPAGTKIVVTGKERDGHAHQARFVKN